MRSKEELNTRLLLLGISNVPPFNFCGRAGGMKGNIQEREASLYKGTISFTDKTNNITPSELVQLAYTCAGYDSNEKTELSFSLFCDLDDKNYNAFIVNWIKKIKQEKPHAKIYLVGLENENLSEEEKNKFIEKWQDECTTVSIESSPKNKSDIPSFMGKKLYDTYSTLREGNNASSQEVFFKKSYDEKQHSLAEMSRLSQKNQGVENIISVSSDAYTPTSNEEIHKTGGNKKIENISPKNLQKNEGIHTNFKKDNKNFKYKDAIKLLVDYIGVLPGHNKVYGSISRFFSGKWNRKNIDAVEALLKVYNFYCLPVGVVEGIYSLVEQEADLIPDKENIAEQHKIKSLLIELKNQLFLAGKTINPKGDLAKTIEKIQTFSDLQLINIIDLNEDIKKNTSKPQF